jgi:hypothetical protein
MSGLLGTQLEEDYIDIGGVKLPLPKSPANQADEYGVLRTTPLEPFQASTVMGDDSLISDDRIAQAVFSDFRPGLGKRRYTELDSLGGYQDGDLDTNDAGYTTLPRLAVTLTGTLAGVIAAPAQPNRMATGFLYSWTGTYYMAMWVPDETLFQVYVPAGPNWQVPANAQLAFGGYMPKQGMARFGGLYVCCTVNTGIFTSPDGFVWTQRWIPGGTLVIRGLVEHDNKLYAVVQDFSPLGTNGSIKMYWVATNAQLIAGTAWPAVSVDAISIDPGEVVVDVVDWKDRLDDPRIYVITNRRILAYNDADFWTKYAQHHLYDETVRPTGFVFPRDELLYVGHCGSSKAVKVYNNQTIEDVGPWREGGFVANALSDFTVSHFSGNDRWMFAFCKNRNASGAGRVLRGNDSFGWSTAARATQASMEDFDSAVTNNLTGGFYAEPYLVTSYANGVVKRQFMPTRGDLAPYNTDFTYDVGPRWLYSAEFDAGNEDLWKLAKWWRVQLETLAGAYALGAGQEFYIKWQIDGGAWSTVTTLTSASAFPNTIPLPSLADQRGLPFRKLRFAIGIDGGTTSTTTPPLLRALILGYTREPDIYDGLQVVVDLSEERFTDGSGLPITQFYGLDRQALRNYIDTLKSGPGTAKRHYPVTIGWSGYQKVYASMDVRVAGVEDPQDRFGRFSLTLRDVTARPSG